MATEREMFSTCEVKRRRVRTGGGYEPFWKIKAVADAVEDNDTEFRCKDCGGAVKIVRTRAENNAGVFIAHKLKIDSEYCAAGIHFLKATDGRASRMSSTPVH